MKLLHIDSSILGEHSASRQLSAAIVARLGGGDGVYRDLAAQPLRHLSGAELAVAQGAVATPEVAAAVAESRQVLEEFLAADTVVIGAPMYNFTIPSQLKAWIDRIVVKGKTFQYGASGPEGLAGDKRVIFAISRGGFYGPGTPAQALEHLETYLRGIFGFIGIAQPEVIIAEGLMTGAEQREKAMTGALAAASHLAAA